MVRVINSLTLLLWEQTCGCQGGGRLWKVRLGGWEEQMQAIMYRMDKQQCPTIQQGELCSLSCDKS